MIDELLAEAEERHGYRVRDGVQILPGGAVLKRPFDPGLHVLIVPEERKADRADAPPRPGGDGFEPATLPGRQAHGSGPTALLRALYPPGHPVLGLAGSSDTTVAELTDDELSAGARLVPALSGELNAASPHGLPWLVARLRAPDGCPWDREQTHQSLRKFLLEESYEVYDLLESGSSPALAEELGDLLLQIVLHAHYAAEAGVFDLTEVYRGVMTKIVRRHPHVFGDVEARSVDQVVRNWEQIKADERARRADDATDGRVEPADGSGLPPAFAGLSRSLPALAYAQEMQERAAAVGYDWPDVRGVADKIEEEMQELLAAADRAERREELGDLLFVTVNLGRKLGVDTEEALRSAAAKFARRFGGAEALAAARGARLNELSPDALDELWEAAKSAESAGPVRAEGSGG